MSIIATEKLVSADRLYLLFSRATRHPFVTYDAETGVDRIQIYTEMDGLEKEKAAVEKYGYLVHLVELPKANFNMFFINLHALGVTQVVCHFPGITEAVALDEIAKLDFSGMPVNQRPHLNPALQLTSLYFLQELTRNVPADQLTETDLQTRNEVAEEMAHNLREAQYMLPIHLKKGTSSKGGTRLSSNSFDPVYTQDGEGKKWIPVMSDVTEFELFNKDNNLSATLVNLEQIDAMCADEFEGMILNPACQAYRMPREAIRQILDNYSADQEKQ